MKTNIVLIVTIIVLCYLLFKEDSIETIIKEKIEIAEICEVIDNTKPTKVVKEYVYINKKDKNIVYDNKEVKKFSLVKGSYSKKEVNKFIFKDSLKNGFLTSTILADNIYKRRVQLTTFEKTKTIEKQVFHPRFYLGGMLQTDGFKTLNTASFNIYLAKQKHLLGIGYGYDLINNNDLKNLTLAFKL